MYVWNKVFHTDASITETVDGVERTVLTLPYDGHEQDVDAMLKLYDNPEELTFSTEEHSDTTQKTDGTTQTTTQKTDSTTQKTDGTTQKTDNTTQKTTQTLSEIQQTIVDMLKEKPRSSRNELSELIGNITPEGVKYHLNKLQEMGVIRREGPDKGGKWIVIES